MNGTAIQFKIVGQDEIFTGYDTGDRRSWGICPYVTEETLRKILPFCEDCKYDKIKRVLHGSGMSTKEVVVFISREIRLLFSTFLLPVDLEIVTEF